MKQEFIDQFNTLKKVPQGIQLSQQRGRDFEELINNIFKEEKVLLRRGFHTTDNKSEQIDGAIEIDNRIFLIETKWVQSNLAASDLFSFIGKIENKFFGTLGIFISKEELSENFINALNKGRRQAVLVIHGEDIDLLFDPKNKLEIKKYISHSLKLCSYDNILHFPVKKYLNFLKDEDSVENIENINEDSMAFIKKNLWKTPISEADLILKIEENGNILNNKIFEKIISMYSQVFNTSFKDLNFDFTIIENFDKFLRQFKADPKTLKITAKDYYRNLIFKDFNIYHRPSFSNTFSKYYNNIPSDERNEIENKLVENFGKAFRESNWNLENYITDIIKPIWEIIANKEDFKKFYLPIYLRDTLDKFSQKKFAVELAENDEFSAKFTKNWLTEKIRDIYKDYNKTIEDTDIKFVARTYVPLNKILGVDNWIEYINSLFEKVKLEET
ncbi:hypothetical protein [Chryseobacterium lathyri]|uniref:Restriction endonuclease type IV Mrr domain-containing protein n=1 Tax=Chryseobacterium lathyri TaxID=395933 RepID=A0ABT9SIL9_9FLAO|nr:hypothetical protein [Chryseobacterium lathyri]MDP9959279.1 hypothetical protein [Chryseobacterium lathyri]